MTSGKTEIFVSSKRPFDISEEIKSGMKRHSLIDQNILDEIGVESTDSESDDDIMPVPSLYAQSRISTLSRSKSMGSFDTSAEDDYSGANFCSGTPVMPSPKRFATGIEPQQPAQSLDGGMRRSASMPCMKISRSDYNRAVGDALANSPKKAPVNTDDDLAILEKLLNGL
uniref:Uncharacterized protein n=1 Tax=Cryptomonas curvata TaxID=233186 RepID=A0A7S0MIX0_9CRYP|mmetsp:Transcript_43600/g.91307  ORF Transcript_43600/g.91307 Transcript_43600/m.91307 type:complete len:170 (+) Transcript_43600:37-546(+)